MHSGPPHADKSGPRPGGRGATSAHVLATWFKVGTLPVAPGTAATLTTIPLIVPLANLPGGLTAIAIALLLLAGIFASDLVARSSLTPDPQIVVVDEVVGALLALWCVRHESWPILAMALLLFRVLDIIKPWPISLPERLRHYGLAIMLDDVAAGLAAGAIASFIAHVS